MELYKNFHEAVTIFLDASRVMAVQLKKEKSTAVLEHIQSLEDEFKGAYYTCDQSSMLDLADEICTLGDDLVDLLKFYPELN